MKRGVFGVAKKVLAVRKSDVDNLSRKVLAVRKSDVDNLSNLLRSSDEFSLITENRKYYLTSSRWESLTNTSDVLSEATKLLEYISAVAMIYFPGFPRLESDKICEVDEKGKRHNRVELLVKILRGLDSFSIQLEGGQDIIPILEFDSWRKLAKEDEIVKDVFRQFREFEHTWINLYKIYEIVEKNAGKINKKIDRIEEWITKKKISQFTQTANSRRAIGDDARHGVHDKHPPKEPMSLSEAQALIRNLLKQWLQWKCEQQK
ncbi:hypothetical protein Q5692_15445 [Microcoleus sp. C2C3]|uniref:hypothetical protein n=1 Tax=unclassified Microcoleus TaxID=2642155 RepID=UPI002FD48CBD